MKAYGKEKYSTDNILVDVDFKSAKGLPIADFKEIVAKEFEMD